MPDYSKTILCLANSTKTSGRCIAGREVTPDGLGRWIRPVSAREHGEVSEDERRFEDGADPRVLDVITIPFKRPLPSGYQIENHLIDHSRHWMLRRRATAAEVVACVDENQATLWGMGQSSTHGRNDRVREVLANRREGSLRLIRVDDLVVQIQIEGAEYDNAKRKMRGAFTYNNRSYLLGITDPVIRRHYFLNHGVGRYHHGASLLTVSLGEAYRGYAYKLIAAVIAP